MGNLADTPHGELQTAAVRTIDWITRLTGTLSAIALVVMTAIVCFEIFSRYVLNEPTYWGTDYATYILVGMTFVGLAQAQKSGAHVRVELLTGAVSEENQRHLEIFANWLSLIFAIFAAWQMAAFNFQEYVNGTRDWGLLATPQWIPESFVTLGYLTFVLAILADIFRDSLAGSRRETTVVFLLAVLLVLLLFLGPDMVRINRFRLDVGSAAIVVAIAVCVFVLNGPRMFLAVAGSILAAGAMYWAAKGTGLVIVGALLVATLFVLLIIGVRVAITLGLVGLLGLMFLLPSPQLSLLAERSWNSINTFTLTAVPMFVLMGALLIRSGVTKELFDSLSRWFGRTPGGIGHATVGASAVFAAVSGSSLATAATMGKVACPEMTRRGYSARLTYGVVAAGATLGILIPPSIAMIIYGTTVGVPVTQLFVAGIIPGIVLSLGFMACVTVWSFVRPDATPRGEAYSISEKISGSISIFPFLLIIVAVLGSLYAGVATPSEAGGVGAAASLLVALYRRSLSWRGFYETAIETARVTSFLLLIVVGAAIMSWVFDFLRIPRTLVGVVEGADLAPWLVVVIIALFYVILGMFIESISMMLMTLPVTYPIMMSLGVDPIWFGVFLVIMIELGLVTPPVGIILFILRGVSEDVPVREIVYGVIPFVSVILVFLVLIYLVPGIVLWLPGQTQ